MKRTRKRDGTQEKRVTVAQENYNGESKQYEMLLQRHRLNTHIPKTEIKPVFDGLKTAAYEAHKTAMNMKTSLSRLAELLEAGDDTATLAALAEELQRLDMIEAIAEA